jgi:acyl-CoA thioester hydrolase
MHNRLDRFRHKIRIQLRFKDLDSMGHVNNANHLTYFELARVSYFHEVVKEEIDWHRQGIILARMEIDYKSPILLDDEVWVYVRVSGFGRTSFSMEYIVVSNRSEGTVVAASGKSVQVCFDYSRNLPIEVPASWKSRVEGFELPDQSNAL